MENVPPEVLSNVFDQILLWEQEEKRVLFDQGYLYEDFEDAEEYNLVKTLLDSLGALVWADEESQRLFGQTSAHTQVKTALQARRS